MTRSVAQDGPPAAGRPRRWSSCRRTRRTIASAIPSWCSAAATPAAGPEPTVNDGRRRNASTLIAPPSPRRTSSGTSRPASSSACSTRLGRALDDGEDAGVDRGADRARLEAVGAGQLVAGAGGQARARAREPRRSVSCSGSSTEKAPLTATAAQPAAGRGGRAPRRRRPRRARAVASRNTCSVSSERPGASAMLPTRVRLRASRRSGALPMPITPTRRTSPSSRAFIACVVENATSSIAMPVAAELARGAARARRDARGDAVVGVVRGRHDRVRDELEAGRARPRRPS